MYLYVIGGGLTQITESLSTDHAGGCCQRAEESKVALALWFALMTGAVGCQNNMFAKTVEHPGAQVTSDENKIMLSLVDLLAEMVSTSCETKP